MFIAGEEQAPDFARARLWLEKAAAQNFARSQYTLGKLYDYGLGVERDRRKASELFLTAGRQGFARAQYNLGKLYRDGRGGLEANLGEAVAWFRKAAMQGHAKAQEHLATRYARGEGVARDDVAALAWLNLAAAQGLETAINNRKALVLRLSEGEISAAKRLSNELASQVGK